MEWRRWLPKLLQPPLPPNAVELGKREGGGRGWQVMNMKINYLMESRRGNGEEEEEEHAFPFSQEKRGRRGVY